MADVVTLPSSGLIDVEALRRNSARTAAGLIAPATEETYCELAPEHAAEPIKSLDDIYSISQFLISNKRWRDNMLFIVGINFGLRVSDLRALRFCNLINDNFTYKTTFAIFEKKTRNTRKRKRNRYIAINDAVIEAVNMYLEHTKGVDLSSYMFVSESTRTMVGEKNTEKWNKPLSNQSIDRILKGIARDLNLNMKMSTHTLRKTFCYHQMVMSNNDTRKLLLLQRMLNHSSPAQTLDYIGITSEEIEEAYKQLNLGSSRGSYLVNSEVYEKEA